jgi:hypothetical protein
MAFCVSSNSPLPLTDMILVIYGHFRILAMQVFLYEMVGKFSFSLPKDDPVRVGLAGTIFPMRSDGKKGAPICVKRLS